MQDKKVVLILFSSFVLFIHIQCRLLLSIAPGRSVKATLIFIGWICDTYLDNNLFIMTYALCLVCIVSWMH